MSTAPEDTLARMLDEAGEDSSEAAGHLAAGRPIYYRTSDLPPRQVIKQYPDGRRELVSFETGRETLIGELSAA
ncbi:hypothetical protein [Tistrella sp.]|jgi:hypothetical protein|nr:hypothetical protein [Tistrella sp.]|tara:strand:- start:1482 stop:1703 length:222 start_codon:yes stop_codon:yes gene_type:complete